MGCTQSKVDNEEPVLRCKQRKQYMKDAVTNRNVFAAAHSSYITLLKNTGGALNDFAAGETTDIRITGLWETPRILDPFFQPPPKPPSSPLLDRFLEPSSIHRSASMPAIALQKAAEDAAAGKRGVGSPKRKGAATIVEDEDAELEEGEREAVEEEAVRVRPPPPLPRESNPPPMPPPVQSSPWEFFDILNYQSHGAEARNSVDEPQHLDHAEIKQINIEDDSGSGGDDEDHKEDDTDAHEYPVRAPEKVMRPSDSSNTKNVVAAPPKEDLRLAVQSVKGGGGGVKRGKDLLKLFEEIDDNFLKASESGLEVSKMLEANRLHYHSNFADNNGLIDPERVKKVITWNSSFKENRGPGDGNDSIKQEEKESHASVLDKLLAWEKKLYDEVKAGELMKLEYQKKIALLNKQKKRGSNLEALEKTKAAVKYLHTRYMVDFQSMDATSLEIQRLRDEQLYPKLVDLVSGLAKMWKTMYEHHRQQKEIIANVKGFDILNAPEETSKQHHDRTLQLQRVVNEWHQEFGKLVQFQKMYISALVNWLRLNLIPIESNLKEKVSSPSKPVTPPIHDLLKAWLTKLDKLSDTGVVDGIKSFAAQIQNIVSQQEEELKQKTRCEAAEAELKRKQKAFEELEERYREKARVNEQIEANNSKDPLMERSRQLDILRKNRELEHEKYLKSCKATRTRSLTNLKSGLRFVFEALTSFSETSSEVYSELHSELHMSNIKV